MNNISHLLIFTVSFLTTINAQNFVPNYIENAYLLDNQISGTARYKAMSGAMSSLGGDLSAVGDNPAGLAVFNTSEASITFGGITTNIETPSIAGRAGTRESNFKFKFNQLGGGLAIDIRKKESPWKSFAIGINSQNTGNVNEVTTVSRDTGINLTANPGARTFNGYTSDFIGNTNRTNVAFAGNYQDNIFVGASLDFYNTQKEISNRYLEEASGSLYTYEKADSPLTENGNGFGLSLGLIYKPIQEVRLGISYKSPVWWAINRDLPNYNQITTDNGATYFTAFNGFTSSTYDLTTPQTISLGGAYVFGKKGLISIDYSIRDYKSAGILKPSNSFGQENQFINNVYKSCNSVKIGTEYRVNDAFTVRGGYRYEESPFSTARLNNYETLTTSTGGHRTNYYGATTGLSLGFGIKFNQTWYLDGGYNYSARDRELFISGEHIDIDSTVTNPNYLITDFSSTDQGTLLIQNIKEVNHDFSITLGIRF